MAGITGVMGRKRRIRFVLLPAAMAVVALALFGAVGRAAPPTDASVTDYAQCANDGPPSTATDCPGGWINGILNANNSHYAENQVTPQRALFELPAGGPIADRRIDITYLVRKASNHAYDSLATWNHTQTTANRCQGLSASDCVGGDPFTFPIPLDSTPINPVGTSISNVTSAHQLTGQEFVMYGLGTGASAMATYTGPDNTTDSGDVYQTVKIVCSLGPGNDGDGDGKLDSAVTLQLLFGGHLAPGGGSRSWGAGLGASSINGGPYHIRLTNVDGGSIGNRDNQIMSNAILPITTTLTTTLHETDSGGDDLGPNNGTSITVNLLTDGTGVYVKDVATAGAADATGTVAFKYYSSESACTTDTGGTSAGGGSLSGGSATSSVVHFTSTGTFYWRAFLTGTDITQDASSECNELLTVKQNTSTSTTLHQTDSSGDDITPTANNGDPITVPINSYVVDYATVTPSTATGSVAFRLYSGTTASSDCSSDTTGSGGVSKGGTATTTPGEFRSSIYQATSAGEFYWKAFFTGTGGNNNSYSNSSPCEKLTVQKADPTVASAPWLVPQDSATLAGIVSGGSTQATLTFELYPPGNQTCSTAEGAVESVFQQVVNVDNGDDEYSTTNSGDSTVNDGYRLTSASPHGVYHWHVEYSGDEANNMNDRGCVEAFDFEGITDQDATDPAAG